MSSGANASSIYGGDEINAIVLDLSSYFTKIGYAGDDFPRIITPSFYAQPREPKEKSKESTNKGKNAKSDKIFGEAINIPRSNYEIKPIMKDSMIIDWEGAVEQYRYYFDTIMRIDYKEQPILITEPVWSPPQYRQKLIETFYESFDFPALFLAKSPTCVSFHQGRPNCLVVEIGHSSVSVSPVADGISLLNHSMRTHYAGEYLSDQIEDLISRKFPGLALDNRYRIKNKTPTKYPEPAVYTQKDLPKDVSESYDAYQRQSLWHEIKESMLEVPEAKLNGSNSQKPQNLKSFYSQDSFRRSFEMPTGQSIELSLERFLLADALFDPESYPFENETLSQKYPPNNGELSSKNIHDDYRPIKRSRKMDSNQSTPSLDVANDSSNKSIRGLTHLVSQILSTVDIDLRASIANNIIVTGGVSLIPQLTDRLYNELSNMNPGLKFRLHAVGNASERICQSWIGGSILSSLGTFHQMWVSREEYNESGTEKILNQRFR